MSGFYSFWTQSVKANVIQMTYAMASAFWTRSVRTLFLPDAECQGKCYLDDTCNGIWIPDAVCQGKYPPDDVYHGSSLLNDLYRGIYEKSQGILPYRHSMCLTDADCQGKCRLIGVCHGIYFPDEEC